MKRIAIAALALFLVAGTVPAVFAQDTPKPGAASFEVALRRIEKIMTMDDMRALAKMLTDVKTVGISWDESILVPTSGIFAGKSFDQQVILWGMLSLDSFYAQVFEKSTEKILTALSELDTSLDFPRAELNRTWQRIIKEEKVDRNVAMNTAMIRLSKDNPIVLKTFVGGFYGITIETFYILCRLGISGGVTTEYLAFLNSNLLRLRITKEILDSCSDNGELARLLDTEKRASVIASIMSILKPAKGSLTEQDLRSILTIITEVRAPLVAKSR